MLKPKETILSDIANYVGKLTLVNLKSLLTSMINNLNVIVYHNNITSLDTGDNAFIDLVTATRAVGTKAHVNLGCGHNYILTAGTCAASVFPYIVKPADYNAETNMKYWKKDNCWYKEITDANLDGSYYYAPKHDLNSKYLFAIVIDSHDDAVPFVLPGAVDGENNVALRFTDSNNCRYAWAGHITGTWRLLLTT